MSALLVTFGVLVAGLLAVLVWSSGRKPRTGCAAATPEECFTSPCHHLANLTQIRQAFEVADLDYLAARGGRVVAKRVKGDRRRVGIAYLNGLRGEFDRLMEATARIAAFSPEVQAKQEWRRFRLALEFRLRYSVLRLKFAVGALSFHGLRDLASMLSTLAVELESTMGELAAAAALGHNPSRSAQT